MGAKYLYRMDDITPNMDWKQFWKYISLFKSYGVKPLLGIVPDCHDQKLSIEESNPNFWEVIREIKQQEIVEIAQHGYQHRLFSILPSECLGITCGSQPLSEFAGLSYNTQYRKIKAGQNILRKEGLYTDIWMAPCHTFDSTTLKVLSDLGFTKATDGIFLFPFSINGLCFIPQQLWTPRWFPAGIFTICLHVNSSDDELFRKVENHLRSHNEIISFGQVDKMYHGIFCELLNFLFRACFILLRRCKKLLRTYFSEKRIYSK